MLLQLLDEVVAGFVLPFLAKHDSSLHDHATDVIGHARDGTLHYGGMRHQRTLHLEGTDAVAAGLDDIVDAALEPIVAVLIAPRHIAGVVEAVVPCLARLLLVAIVLLEETDGLLVTHADNNFTLLTVLARGAVGTDEVDVILCIRDAHGAWLRLHPREGAEGHGGLGLPEAFHHPDAGLLEELVIDSRVQGLTGRGAVFERGEVVLRQILANHEAVDGGGRTEAGHTILLHLSQQTVGIELLMVEDKDRSASKPLAVELTPHSLSPAGIGDRQVKRMLMEVMPEDARRQVPHRIEVVVGHHLRFAAGAAGEVHDHRVLVIIDEGGTHEGGSLDNLCLVITEAFGNGLAMVGDGDVLCHRGTLVLSRLYLADYVGVIHTDDGLDARTCIPIDNVVLGEHVGGWNDDCANLAEGQHHNPPLIAALEYQHHGVTLADT